MFLDDQQNAALRPERIVKRSSDPVKVAQKNPFFDIKNECDLSPSVPVRRYSKHVSDAAKDAFEIRASFLAELIKLDSSTPDDVDSLSCASTVSDLTNPTVFLSVERSGSAHFSEVESSEPKGSFSKDMPPRPAAREVTREVSTCSEGPAILQEEAAGELSPPPPPPPPRPFSGEIIVHSAADQLFPAERLELNDNDTPPRPFPRRLTAASLAAAVAKANLTFDFNDNDTPPRPFSRRSTATAIASAVAEGDFLFQEEPTQIPSLPSALVKLAQEFIEDVPVSTHFHHLKKYENTFVGQDAVDFMLEANLACRREDAVFLGQRFLKELSLFHHVNWDHNFKDGRYFYRFTDNSQTKVSNQPYVSCLELLKLAEAFERDVPVSNHLYHFMNYKNSFVGSEAVDYLVRSKLATDRKHAVFLGQRLLEDFSLFHHVTRSQQFKDSQNLFYRFSRKCDNETSISGDSSVVSISSLLSALQKRNKGAPLQHLPVPAFGISTSARNLPSRPSLKVPMETTASTAEGRAVTFGAVEERVFERTLEMHPSTSSGPSIGLGWSYEDKPATPLDEIAPRENNRRKRDFVLSSNDRKSILCAWGHTRVEMFLAARVNEKIREQRKKTLNNLSAKSLEAESCSSSMLCKMMG